MAIPGPVRELDRIGRYLLGVIIILDFVLDRLWEMGESLIAMARAEHKREMAAADAEKKHKQTRNKKRGKSD